MTMSSHFPLPSAQPAFRRERLRDALRATVDMLDRDRADLIAPGYVEDYLALNWLECRGRGLRLTSSGAALCLQIAAQAH